MMQEPVSTRSWRRLALTVVLLVLSLSVLLLAWPSRKASPGETPRRELSLRSGSWFRVGEARPFTGVMVETYENGQRKSRSEIVNGVPEGLSEGWYTNGQKQVQEHFRQGLSHGPRVKWHANGHKQSEVMVLAGKLEGTFCRWNEDGTLSEEIQLKQGKADGVSRAYYPSGFIKTEVRLRDGQVVDRKTWGDGEHEGPTGTPKGSLPAGKRQT